MADLTHPTVQALGLRTYVSRYDGTTCSICREEIARGAPIARLDPKILRTLHDLGLSAKVFKYAHQSCLPTLIPDEYTPVIREAAEHLWETTDPRWPRDYQGFSSADAGPVEKWLRLGCPALGTHGVAKRLVKYLDTQLGGSDTEKAVKIRSAAAYKASQVENIGKSKGNSQPKSKAKLAPVELDDRPSPVVLAALPGSRVSERKATGWIHIDVDQKGLFVRLDPPWVNAEHAQVKDAIKAATRGRTTPWDKDKKVWRISSGLVAEHADEIFNSHQVSVSPAALPFLEEALQRRALARAASVEEAGTGADVQEKLEGLFPEGLALYPFQTAGVAFLEAAHGRALVGDEMGLGKTIQALAYLALHPELRPALLIVPANVAGNWEDEIQLWLPREQVCRISSGKSKIPADATAVITTYDLARRREEELAKLAPKVIVSDESHYLKNIKTLRTKTVLALARLKSVKSVICLSGTPLLNRPLEFYSTLSLLRPSQFNSWWKYTERYCGAYTHRWGRDVSGASNTEELASKLRDVMIRREKSQVLTELPAKTRSKAWFKPTAQERRAYHRAIDEALRDSGTAEAIALQQITAARVAVSRTKVKPALTWISEYQDQGLPVLVFAHHKEVLDGLETGCRDNGLEAGYRVGRIDGSVSQNRRTELVKAFQAGSLDVMILSTKAAGVGITLTRASNVLFVERMWTPGEEEQAEDRVHRIGQDNAVSVRYLLAEGTVDSDMDELLEEKREILHAVLDGQVTDQSLSIQGDLVKRWISKLK
jgi:SWI/SNF-related matrix-associated actin-dependent regulator 1 of chromatin subfamily A